MPYGMTNAAMKRLWACGRKTRYASNADAQDAAAKREAEGAPPLRTYRCRYCNQWHLARQRGEPAP